MEGYFDFKDFIIRIVKRWRLIIICMLIFGVGLGVFKGATTFPYVGKEISSSGDSQLQKKVDNMEESIDMLDDGISNWDAYYAHSKLMHLDSYNVTVYSLLFSAKCNSNLNYSEVSTIATSCKNMIENGVYYDEISKNTGISEEDLKDLILVTADQGTVEIKGYVYGDIEISKAVDALYDYVIEDMGTLYNNDYIFQRISADYHTGRDEDLCSLQDTIIANGERYISEKSSRGRVIEELRAESPSEVITVQSARQDVIKFTVAGCVAGIIFAIILGLFLDMMNKHLSSEKEIKSEFGLKCFAGEKVLPAKKNIIDRFIENIYCTKHILTEKEWVEYVTSRIINEDINDDKLMIVGSILDKLNDEYGKIDKLTERLNENDISVFVGKSVISDADTIQDMKQVQDIIIVEKVGLSELPLIKEEIDVINESGKRLIGFILV